MVSARVPHFLVALFAVTLPPALLADECASSSASSVRLSASSYRNMTGHWVAQASLIRRSPRDGSDLRNNDRPWHYDVNFTRQSCDDDDTLTTTFSVLAPPARVGADYQYFPRVGFYKLHTEIANWEDARKTCAREGAHLAIVNSEAEENAIREVMKSKAEEKAIQEIMKYLSTPGKFVAFIGFHDMFKEGDHVTIFGNPLSSTGHVNWASGEPNNNVYSDSPEGEDCGDIWSDGTINDAPCSYKLPFVCEQSL